MPLGDWSRSTDALTAGTGCDGWWAVASDSLIFLEAPIWFTVAVAVLMFAFGVFVGYAIAAYQDLRQIQRDQSAHALREEP